MLLLIFIITFGLCFALTPRVVRLSRDMHFYDLPDSRKVHKLPIPRLGGALFLPLVMLSVGMAVVAMSHFDIPDVCSHKDIFDVSLWAYFSGALILYIIGVIDDLVGVGYKSKFLVQFISAALLCASGLWIDNFHDVFSINEVPWFVGVPFTFLFVVFVTNAVNLIDGIDGLASGLSVISLVVISILCIVCHDPALLMLAVAYIGAIIAFFYYNVFSTKNKIFMGDAGSSVLGYTLAFMVVRLWQNNSICMASVDMGMVALSTLLIPCFDTIRVFACRIRHGHNPFLPDKSHIHHKLLQTGLSPRATMITILLISAMLILVNYILSQYLNLTVVVIIDVLLFTLVQWVINLIVKRHH